MQDFWSPLQALIQERCSDFDKTWQVRKRFIDTHFLVLFILKLVLSKNQQGYRPSVYVEPFFHQLCSVFNFVVAIPELDANRFNDFWQN